MDDKLKKELRDSISEKISDLQGKIKINEDVAEQNKHLKPFAQLDIALCQAQLDCIFSGQAMKQALS